MIRRCLWEAAGYVASYTGMFLEHLASEAELFAAECERKANPRPYGIVR